VSPNTAPSPQRATASAATPRESCHAQEHYKREALQFHLRFIFLTCLQTDMMMMMMMMMVMVMMMSDSLV
jgi:hypothetical protein